MKVAIVHDWLVALRGGEKCLKFFLELYPKADIYTLFHKEGSTYPEIDKRVKKVSYLQKICFTDHRKLLPLYPLGARSLKISGYDLVISISHAAAKNVSILGESTLHISYCLTPMRYIWDQAESYLGNKRYLFYPLINRLREWDREGSERVDYFTAISKLVAARIRKYYKRSATIIYPPVDTNWIEPNLSEERDETFLYVGALVPYKRVDVVIEAFNRCKLPLIVAGEGPLYPSLKKIAKKNIKFVGRVSDKELAALYRRCKALMFSGCEDFGMIPVEAMAAGTPVIAPFKGGCKETVKGIRYWQEIKGAQEEEKEASGVFFRYFSSPRRQVEEILRALFFFEKNKERIKAVNCIKQADVFSPERFKREWRIFIALTLSKEKGRGLNKGLVHYR